MPEKSVDSPSVAAVNPNPSVFKKSDFEENYILGKWLHGENPSQNEIDAAWEVEFDRLKAEKKINEEAMKPQVVWSKGNPEAANVVYRRVTGQEPVGRFPVAREAAKLPRR